VLPASRSDDRPHEIRSGSSTPSTWSSTRPLRARAEQRVDLAGPARWSCAAARATSVLRMTGRGLPAYNRPPRQPAPGSPLSSSVSAPRRVLSGMRPTGHCTSVTITARSRTGRAAVRVRLLFLRRGLPCAHDGYEDTRDIEATPGRWSWTGSPPAQSAVATLFIQSKVPEHAELHLLLSMITPLGWLERVPTTRTSRSS